MAISKHSIRSVAVAMSALCLVSSASAFACGGDWYPEVQIDPRIHGVAEAEKALTAGNYVAAAGFVLRMMPHIKTLDPKHDELVARAERVLAVSIARSGGKLGLEREIASELAGHFAGRTRAEQDQSLSWSISLLRTESSIKKDDPAVLTDLAEALSKTEGGRDEARTLLESLAGRDLVATPQGYKALAELRKERGDESGQQLAMKRCESMAGGSHLCDSGAPRPS